MKKFYNVTAKSFILLTFILGFEAFSFAQQDPKALEVLDAMSKNYQEIGAFKSDFTYTMENPAESISEDFSGEIIVSDDKFRLKMGGQEIINNGKTVWTYLEDANEVNIDNYNPDEGDISPSEIFDAYKRGFKYAYLGEEKLDGTVYDVVDLTPENTDNQFYKIKLHIDRANKTLKTWKIFSKDGTHYTYTITNFDPDTKVNDSLFTFDTTQHKGVEVVDLR